VWPSTPVFADDFECHRHICLEDVIAPPSQAYEQEHATFPHMVAHPQPCDYDFACHHQQFFFEHLVAPPADIIYEHEQAIFPHMVVNPQVHPQPCDLQLGMLPPPPAVDAESTLNADQLGQLAQALHARVAELEGARTLECATLQLSDTTQKRNIDEKNAQWKALHDLGLLA